jgi:glycosyltransferase involved in cell wall biosynthesis
MKVAFITFEYPPFVQGGAGVYAYNLVNELAKLGHEVHVIAPRAPGTEKESVEESIFIHRLGFLNKPFLAAISFWFSLRKDFSSLKKRAGGFDIVHSNGLSAFSLRRKAISSPFVITIHHLTKTTLKTLGANLTARVRNLRGEAGISSIIEPYCIRRADRIIAVSQFTKRDIVNIYGIPESKIEVIYHGVQPDNYVFPEEARLKLRSSLGIESQPMALFVGRLVPRKGVDILLRALPRVIKEMDVKLVLAGSGNQSHYQQLAEALDVSDKVTFLGRVPDETLNLLYASCDVFVLPSRLEGLGIVIIEAMAAGKPVIATNAGGIPELIEAGQNGILTEAGNEGELASAIIKVLGDRSLSRTIGENNTRKVQERYSWESAALKAEQLYSDLVRK